MYATINVEDYRLRTSDILYYEVELKKFNATHYRRLRKLDMARSFLEQGFPIEAISTASGLSVEEIKALRKNR